MVAGWLALSVLESGPCFVVAGWLALSVLEGGVAVVVGFWVRWVFVVVVDVDIVEDVVDSSYASPCVNPLVVSACASHVVL